MRTTALYTLSLHDALPIFDSGGVVLYDRLEYRLHRVRHRFDGRAAPDVGDLRGFSGAVSSGGMADDQLAAASLAFDEVGQLQPLGEVINFFCGYYCSTRGEVQYLHAACDVYVGY